VNLRSIIFFSVETEVGRKLVDQFSDKPHILFVHFDEFDFSSYVAYFSADVDDSPCIPVVGCHRRTIEISMWEFLVWVPVYHFTYA